MLFTNALIALPLLAASALSQRTAVAILKPTANQTAAGTVTFQELIDKESGNATIKITATLTGLAPNSKQGFHIHSYGDISSSTGANTWGHFNPFKRNHTGSATAEYVTPALTFDRALAHFVIGRGVMLHAATDDCVTNPTGNAGGRISQGVIGWSSEDSESRQVPTRRRSIRRALSSTTPIDAIAVLSPIAGSGVVGSIYFRQNDGGSPLLVAYNISGLTPKADVGIRLFTLGDITNPAGPSTDASAIYPPADPCAKDAQTMGFTADESGRLSALPLSPSVISIPSLSIYPDSPNSILGRSLALYIGGSDCAASLAVTSFLAQAVIGVRNGTVAPSFNAPPPQPPPLRSL
ncbi:superoxide dismutase [Chytridium lagenaria]|nr:superoxide dismutase [Chytridium lagenaria]